MTATEGTSLVSPTRRSFVDGQFGGGPQSFGVSNPATGRIIAEVGAATVADFDSAVLAARRAFDDSSWRDMSIKARAAFVLAFLDYLDAAESELVSTIVAEAGCPRTVTERAQVRGPLTQVRAAVDLALTLPETTPNVVPLAEVVGPDAVTVSAMRYGPIGVVAAISAYNFPLHLNLWKVVPALLAGNTVVLRPSPLTPLTAFRMAEAAQAANLPAGVLNVVAEPGDEGARLLTTHPAVDVVTFTGSSAVGGAVAAQAAPTLKRVLLELGGKSVGLYFPEAIGKTGANARMMFANHGGQACIAQSRVLVPRRHYDEAVARMIEAAAEMRIGDPEDPTVEIGPLAGPDHAARVARYVDGAVANGATLHTGGSRPLGLPSHLAAHNFYTPTVLGCPDQRLPAVRDEIFGPVICVLAYDDLDHAVALANDSDYALSAGVYGPADAALAVADRIDAGTVFVNRGFGSGYVSSGGWKRSGAGRERGVEGFRSFQRIKHLAISG